jgi:hypothetical protein
LVLLPTGLRPLEGNVHGWAETAGHVRELVEEPQELYDKLTAAGHVVVKAYIDPDTFPKWCQAHGLEMNAKARTRFGNDCAAEHFKAKTE